MTFSFTASHPTAQIRWAAFQKNAVCTSSGGLRWRSLVISTHALHLIFLRHQHKHLLVTFKKWLPSLSRLDFRLKSLQRLKLFNTAFNHSCRLHAGVELMVWSWATAVGSAMETYGGVHGRRWIDFHSALLPLPFYWISHPNFLWTCSASRKLLKHKGESEIECVYVCVCVCVCVKPRSRN